MFDRIQQFARGIKQRIYAALSVVFEHLAPEFFAAVFVASCVTIINFDGWLEDMEIDFLQLVVPQVFGERFQDSYVNSPGSAKIITINNRQYEEYYNQTSPLDRNRLHEILKIILEAKPLVFAVDLDLSPGPAGKSAAETELYKLLKSANTNTEIVLITPQKVFTDNAIEHKTEWMKEMCGAGIRFGLPYLYSAQGVVLKHPVDPNTFAYQVFQAAARQGLIVNQSTNGCFDKQKPGPICESESFEQFVSTRLSPNVSARLRLLDFRSFDFIEPVGNADPKVLSSSAGRLTDKVVFFGGSYGTTDKFESIIGEIAGVYLHAASYISSAKLGKQTGHASPLTVFLIEIVMSSIMGLVFYWLAAYYRNTGSLTSIAANIVIQPLTMLLFIYVSILWMRTFNMWLNPATLIIGMEIHALVASAEEPRSRTQDTNELLGMRETQIKRFIYYGVLVTALGIIAYETICH